MKSSGPRTVVRKPKGPENKWTPEEDEILSAAVAASGFKVCWRKIASSLPGRTNKSCRKRWIHSLDPTLRKGRWTAAEDKILLNAIKTHGTLWYKVAKHLPGRTDDQAAKRWREKLDPSIARTPWTDEEDEILIKVWKKVGKRWNLISRELNGRPAVHCRNRWQSLLRIGKVDGSEQGLDFDYTMCDEDANGEDDEHYLRSPTETPEMQRPSTASSSSSGPSSDPSTPLDPSPTFAFPSVYCKPFEEQDGDSKYTNLSYLPLASSKSPRSPPATAEFFKPLDSIPESGRPQPRLRIDPHASSASSKVEAFRFSVPDSQTTKPNLIMMPHPNMRIINGSSEHSQHHESFQPHFGPSSDTTHSRSFLPSHGATSVQHAPLPVSRPIILPQIQTTNLNGGRRDSLTMTCPLVHCGFQSTNLPELWKHVTWDHVSPPEIPSSRHPHLDHLQDYTTPKMDPVMIDYVERTVLDFNGRSHSRHLEGYTGMECLQLDEFDAAAAAAGIYPPRSVTS